MTSEDTVMRALEGAWRVSYASLLERIRDLGEEPRGMMLALERLERRGAIRQLDRQGRKWIDAMSGANRGPLYIERLGPL